MGKGESMAAVQPTTLGGDEGQRIQRLRSLVRPHLGSFDFAMEQGLRLMKQELEHEYLDTGADAEVAPVRVAIEDVEVDKPRLKTTGEQGSADVLPRQAREGHATYKGDIMVNYGFYRVDTGERIHGVTRRIGKIPIMVGSTKCNLFGLSPAALVARNEEEYELGGYFIINGVEKVVRMIIVNRRHYVLALKRAANANRGVLYSDSVVSMRCCRHDQTSRTNHLHYLTSGGANLRLTIRRQELFLPVVLLIKALIHEPVTDSEIFDRIVGTEGSDSYLRDRALSMIKDAADLHRGSRLQILAFLGSKFRSTLRCPSFTSDADAGRQLLRQYVLVHLSAGVHEPESPDLDACKVDVLVHMVRKLLALVRGDISEDNPDALMNQEVLLPGHLYLMYLREKLEEHLRATVAVFERDLRTEKTRTRTLAELHTPKYLLSLVQRNTFDISRRMEYFLATGNLQTQTGLDLLQASGYSVVAERINFWRFIAHFRSIHRGQFFNDIKTTSVRKLLPDAWGFICPVHTPDGAPCGLLNHLTAIAEVSLEVSTNADEVEVAVGQLGGFPPPAKDFVGGPSGSKWIPIVADGRVVGSVEDGPSAAALAEQLRALKMDPAVPSISMQSEVSYVPSRRGGPFPGIYIFSGPARLVRPVRWLTAPGGAVVESIGSFEQIHLRIRGAVRDGDDMEDDQDGDSASHEELSATGILSVLASLTPFSDMNQSPRNMYQCQMGKQALGTPCHMYSRRSDSKTYRLLTGQSPITRNRIAQDALGIDVFPNGTNAVVAVISYTGYDMEDAMVINKSSLERGFCQAFVYTTTIIDLDDDAAGKTQRFGCPEGSPTVGSNGLPEVGVQLKPGDHLYAVVDEGMETAIPATVDGENVRRRVKYFSHKGSEVATVDQVRLLPPTREDNSRGRGCRRALIRLRYRRDPMIGDKFASRAGQKGTMSCLWPETDMPFSESGIIPDILFNPNGFPSRMTIGMMVESMCGKSGAVHGVFQDSTPFRFDERQTAANYFGDQLLAAGYNRYGNETLYSGYTGEPFHVEIFTGVVHYQRLRHMVSDKFQVRSNGPINPLTRQPIKGRKAGGAIRFGEMERDALLGHGAAYLLHDRLSVSSDLHAVWVCANCRSVLSPVTSMKKAAPSRDREVTCRVCGVSKERLRRINMPYVFKYLANELAAMNIKTMIDVK